MSVWVCRSFKSCVFHLSLIFLKFEFRSKQVSPSSVMRPQNGKKNVIFGRGSPSAAVWSIPHRGYCSSFLINYFRQNACVGGWGVRGAWLNFTPQVSTWGTLAHIIKSKEFYTSPLLTSGGYRAGAPSCASPQHPCYSGGPRSVRFAAQRGVLPTSQARGSSQSVG